MGSASISQPHRPVPDFVLSLSFSASPLDLALGCLERVLGNLELALELGAIREPDPRVLLAQGRKSSDALGAMRSGGVGLFAKLSICALRELRSGLDGGEPGGVDAELLHDRAPVDTRAMCLRQAFAVSHVRA
jgi:hypothetical protein